MVVSKRCERVSIVLELTEDEARWLMGLVQNRLVVPEHDADYVEESEEDASKRANLFRAIQSQLERP